MSHAVTTPFHARSDSDPYDTPEQWWRKVEFGRPFLRAGSQDPETVRVRALDPQDLAIAGAGFLVGSARLFGEMSPFGIAYLAAWRSLGNHRKATMAAVGALFGAIVWNGWQQGLEYLLMLAFTYLALGRALESRRRIFYVPCMVFGVSSVLRALWAGFLGVRGLAIFPIVLESALSAFLSVPFLLAISLLTRGRDTDPPTREESVSFMVFAAAVIAGFLPFHMGFLSLGTIFGSLAVLAMGFLGGAAVGAISGVTVGLISSMSFISSSISPSTTLPLAGMYSLGGLLAGFGREYDRAGASMGFVLGAAMFSFQMGSPEAVVASIGQVVIASVAFAAMPAPAIMRLKRLLPGAIGLFQRHGSSGVHKRKLQGLTSKKLKDFSQIFGELAETFQAPPEDAVACVRGELASVLEAVAYMACRKCPAYGLCWGENFHATYRGLLDLLALLEVKHSLDPTDLPNGFEARCTQAGRLLSTINRLYDAYNCDYHWERKLVEARRVVSQQLKGLATIMEGLASELMVDMTFESDLEQRIARELRRLGFRPSEVSAMSLRGSMIEVEIHKPSCGRGSQPECTRAIIPIVSRILGRSLTVVNPGCGRHEDHVTCNLRLVSTPNYEVRAEVAQLAMDSSHVSGDTHSFLELKDGRYAIVLSDGMGVGPEAAMESGTTASMLERLIETGFDNNFAVHTVNSILLLRSPDETFATVDLVVVDLHTAEAEFVKVGSSPSFIKRGREIGVVKCASLPAGIFNSIEIEKSTKHLRDGDLLVLVSDGVLDARRDLAEKEEWMINILRRFDSDDPGEVARYVLDRAKENTRGRPHDDMTVIVAKVMRRARRVELKGSLRAVGR